MYINNLKVKKILDKISIYKHVIKDILIVLMLGYIFLKINELSYLTQNITVTDIQNKYNEVLIDNI